jgi:hypothetical protein
VGNGAEHCPLGQRMQRCEDTCLPDGAGGIGFWQSDPSLATRAVPSPGQGEGKGLTRPAIAAHPRPPQVTGIGMADRARTGETMLMQMGS